MEILKIHLICLFAYLLMLRGMKGVEGNVDNPSRRPCSECPGTSRPQPAPRASRYTRTVHPSSSSSSSEAPTEDRNTRLRTCRAHAFSVARAQHSGFRTPAI